LIHSFSTDFLVINCFIEKLIKDERQTSSNKIILRGVEDSNGGCNCNSTTCDCCQDIPDIKTSICLDSYWNQEPQTIFMQATFGGFNLGSATFSEKDPRSCMSIAGGSVCLTANNLTVAPYGACGCWYTDIDFFGVKLNVEVGCFAFGDSPDNCPGSTACSALNDCNSCDAKINCGWCDDTNLCLVGDNNGPYKPGNCSSINWEYHSSQC